MLTSYSDFETYITSILKIRSKNYINTDCDIATLIDIVFSSIVSEIILLWEIEEYTLDKENPQVELLSDNRTDDDITTITKWYREVYDIVDADGVDVMNYFHKIDDYTYIVTDEDFLKFNDRETFLILRRVIPDIRLLDPYMYTLILQAMVEGLMYQIEDSIPSNVDGQLANLHYQRFYAAKKELKEKLPQMKWLSEKQTGAKVPNYSKY